jgi:type IV fimbrial biogenesis protein FimT
MHKSAGMTLIELLVVMTIVAVLASLVAPSFQNMITTSRVSSAVNTFLSDMRYARSEAVRRGSRVVICRSDAPEAASPSCSSTSSRGWAGGWLIFEDRDGLGTYSSTDILLRVQAAMPSPDSIIATGAGGTSFTFVGFGRLTGQTGVSTLTFGGSSIASSRQRVVCVGQSGRPRIAGDGSTSCGSDI